jgi:hypothetical protein
LGPTCFSEEIQNRDQNAEGRNRLGTGAFETTEGDIAMSEDIELVRGSGNVFWDFGIQNADAEQLRTILAAQIICALDERNMTVRQAESLTGIAAADFSRIAAPAWTASPSTG